MQMVLRILGGLGLAALGSFITYALYSLGENQSLNSPDIAMLVGAMALVSLVVSLRNVCKIPVPGKSLRASVLYSYAAFAGLYFLASVIEGQLGEYVAWFLVIALFGAILTLPLIAGIWAGVFVALGMRNKSFKQPAAAGTR